VSLMDVVNTIAMNVFIVDESRVCCSTCGNLKDSSEFYIRKSQSYHPNGMKNGPPGAVVQPCIQCKLLYESLKRKARRDARLS